MKLSLNTAATKDMTVGKPATVMLQFTLPILLSQLFQQLYNTADSLIVGRFLGTDALAAVSSSGNLIFLLVSFFTGTSMGVGVVISRYFGAGNHEKVNKAVHTGITLGIVSGILLTIAGVFLTPTLLVWMKTDPDVLPGAISYFRVYFLGAIFMILYNDCRGILNAVGDSKRPLRYLIISSITNVILDILFIGVFRCGVWAAAFATVLSQALSVVLCFFYLAKPGMIISFSIRKMGFDRELLPMILRYGLPSGVQNSVIAFANVIVLTNINSFGKYATAGAGSYSKIEGFVFLPITSFTLAITTFISQNLGAGKVDRAKQGARFGIVSSIVCAEAVGLLTFWLSPHLIGLFDSSPEMIAYGVRQQRIMAPFYFLLAFSHSVAAVCRGAGKAFVPMLVMLSSWCLFRILYIELMMHFFGDIIFIYWAYPITWTISAVIYAVYYYKSDWVHAFEKERMKKERKESIAKN